MKLQTMALATLGLIVSAIQALGFEYPVDSVIYEGSIGNTKVKVTGSARPFVKAVHRTSELQISGSDDKQGSRPATVDEKSVVGTDQTLPKDGLPQLSALTVWFGSSKVEVPVEFLHHVFLPKLRTASFKAESVDTLIAFSTDGRTAYISLAVGDGGGAGTYNLFVGADGSVSTKPIQRPEP
jgi:hypothetical protein